VIVASANELNINIVISRVQLRAIQLLSAGFTLDQVASALTNDSRGRESYTDTEVYVMASQFSQSLSSFIGLLPDKEQDVTVIEAIQSKHGPN
jgi:hypothetical protein